MKPLTQAERDDFFANTKNGDEVDIICKNETIAGKVIKKTDVIIVVQVKGRPRHFFFKQKIQWS